MLTKTIQKVTNAKQAKNHLTSMGNIFTSFG